MQRFAKPPSGNWRIGSNPIHAAIQLKGDIMKKLILASAIAVFSFSAQARDNVHIVGSSTVFPFSTAVAEDFGRTTAYQTPVVESTGSGGGLKLFCAGVGVDHPDITNASRPIKSSEVELCAKNGVTDITEVLVGYDGIVLGGVEQMTITVEQLREALREGSPHEKWSDVSPELPNVKIQVLGPPPTSGTRDAFNEMVMDDEPIREDGAYIEAGENDNLILQKLVANPDYFGIFGFSFLDQNRDKINGSLVNGVEPTFDAIADGSYPISRSLFFYVKDQHVGVIKGIKEYVDLFLSDKASGEYGYLADKGLIPVMEGEQRVRKVE